MGGQHAKPATSSSEGDHALGPDGSKSRGATIIEEAAEDRLEVSLVRQGGEAWGISWTLNTDDDHRLIVAGISPGSAVGRWNAARRACGLRCVGHGDELLNADRSQRPGRGHEEVRLVFRPATSTARPRETPAGRTSDSPAAAAPTRRSSPAGDAAPRPATAWRQRPLLEVRPVRVKNTFVYVSDDSDEPSDKSTEGSPEERTTQSDPFPVSQFSRASLKPAHPPGILAGGDPVDYIVRMAAEQRTGGGADSPWTSDYGWASARSAGPVADDGSLAAPAADSAGPSCPSTDWEFLAYEYPAACPLVAFPTAAYPPAAFMAAYPGPQQPSAEMLANAVQDSVEDDIFVTSEDSADELPPVANGTGGKGDVLKVLEPARCRDLLQPLKQMGALPKGSEWDTDESTTVANSSLAERRRTRRAGKRARGRPCHQRGKEGGTAATTPKEEGNAAHDGKPQEPQCSLMSHLGTAPPLAPPPGLVQP